MSPKKYPCPLVNLQGNSRLYFHPSESISPQTSNRIKSLRDFTNCGASPLPLLSWLPLILLDRPNYART
jgi:hypothetical protein